MPRNTRKAFNQPPHISDLISNLPGINHNHVVVALAGESVEEEAEGLDAASLFTTTAFSRQAHLPHQSATKEQDVCKLAFSEFHLKHE